MDAVRAPAGLPGIPEGTIICRATIADPTYGCVPSSIMGPGAMNAAAAAWINTNAWSDRTFTDNTVAANLRGPLFDGWAGPILVAVGAEYRTNASQGNNDPNTKRTEERLVGKECGSRCRQRKCPNNEKTII